MFQQDLRALLAARAAIESEDDFAIEQCQMKETGLICTHIDEAVAFLLRDCTAEEFSWLSEVFPEVAMASKSHAFIQTIRALLQKYPEESRMYSIALSVDEAEDVLRDLEENAAWYQFWEDIRALIAVRSRISPKDEPAILQCNEKMADLLCAHMEDAIVYLQNSCTGEEYVWVSEVFPAVAERTGSTAFVQAIRTLPRKYPRETRRYDITRDIARAERILEQQTAGQ